MITRHRLFPAVSRARAWGCALAVVHALLCTCTQVPTESGGGGYQITLSLEEKGRREATYWGAPVDLLVELPESLSYTDLGLHLGAARQKARSFADDSIMRRMTLPLYWSAYPAILDSATSFKYDTLFISVGGERYRSNTVRVYVRNLPPLLDSISISDTGFNVAAATIPTFLPDSADYGKTVRLRIHAHDLDREALEIAWRTAVRPLTRVASGIGSYALPRKHTEDTITVTVSDNNGGTARTRVRVYAPNRAPHIDSVTVMGERRMPAANFSYYTYDTVDSLALRAFAHDGDTLDSLRIVWNARHLSRLRIDSSDSFSVDYICSAPVCTDSLTPDTIVILDTVRMTVYDRRGDSAVAVCRILRGAFNWNYYPVIDSLRIDAIMYQRSGRYDTTFRHTAAAGDTLLMSLFCHDRDRGDSLNVTAWRTRDNGFFPMTLFAPGIYMGQYVADTGTSRDTTVFVVGDNHGAESWIRAAILTQGGTP